MSQADTNPFEPKLTPGRARMIPWLTVVGGSACTALPLIATVPILPPLGLVMLLAWRLLARFALRPWAAAPLGLFDDLVSGQPLGSAVLIWSVIFLAIDLIESRLVFRDFWQDWLIAAGATLFAIIMGRVLALPIGARVDGAMLAQAAATILLFPIATRFVAWIDRKRGMV